MIKIVFLDKITVPGFKLDLDVPFSLTEIELCPADQVADALKGHEVVITNKVKITREAMEANPQLKLIAVSATGFNHIDIIAAKALGITVCNVKGYSTRSVAEQAFTMLLALVHQFPAYDKKVRAGEWQRSNFFSLAGPAFSELKDKTLVIAGKGDIGCQLAKYAEAFAMKVVYAEHKNATTCRSGYTPFIDALKQADVLSIHCPLNEQTFNLIGLAELDLLKPQSIVLNLSRGGLVDEQALANALLTGKIAGAGFDVLTIEPPAKDNPLLNPQLTNFILTPHIGWASDEAITSLTTVLAENINAFIGGKPINVVS